MIIGTAAITIYLPESHSLKEKRSVLQSVIKKIRNKFNAAVAEIENQDKWQKCTIGIAIIGGNTAHADSQLQSIINYVEAEPRFLTGAIEVEIF